MQLVSGASCGAPTLIIPNEYHCHTIELGPGTGMMCSCTTSFCTTMIVAQLCAGVRRRLQPRNVCSVV